MKTLISMVEFVLQQEKKGLQNTDRHLRFGTILNYAKFLSQPLKLEMFVPVDENGNVLEEPNPIHTFGLEPEDYEYDDNEVEIYRTALSKVLFDGLTFEEETEYFYYLIENGVYSHVINKRRPRTVESLIGMDNLKLTDNAIKQIGL